MYFDCVNRILKFYKRYWLWSIDPRKGNDFNDWICMCLTSRVSHLIWGGERFLLWLLKIRTQIIETFSQLPQRSTEFERMSRKKKQNKESGWGLSGAWPACGEHPSPPAGKPRPWDTGAPELCPPTAARMTGAISRSPFSTDKVS